MSVNKIQEIIQSLVQFYLEAKPCAKRLILFSMNMLKQGIHVSVSGSGSSNLVDLDKLLHGLIARLMHVVHQMSDIMHRGHGHFGTTLLLDDFHH